LHPQVAFFRVFCTLKIVSGEGWKEKFQKKSKYSSYQDLSIELFNVEFRALESLDRVFCDIFARLSRVFRALNVVSGEGYGRKILKKIPLVPLD